MATTQQIFQFKSRFPEFETAADADVSSALDTSALWIDPAVWSINDYAQALALWAAHFLTLKQIQLASVQFGGTGSSDIYVRSVSFGERRVVFDARSGSSYGEKMLGPGEQLLLQTIYGQMYITLRARNVIPVAIV